MSEWAVETQGLVKRFGRNTAVNNVDLRIPRGCAFGYLGPNGAGKTTLIRVLLGLTRADAGSMSLLGYPVPKERAKALARVGRHRRRAALPPAPERSGEPGAAGQLPRVGSLQADRPGARAGRTEAACRGPGLPSTRWACASG